MRILLACLVSLAGAVQAAPADDYAAQWPLSLSGDEGAYAVTLEGDVYREATSAALRDVDVVDADGVAVPAQLLPQEAGSPAAGARVPVRWFVLPVAEASGPVAGRDWSLAVERSADGRVLRVESREPGDRDVASGGGPDAWLVDASGVDGFIVALHLEWAEAEGVDLPYRIDISADLRDWRTVAETRLLDLSREGGRLQQRRVPVDAQARYLRLVPRGGSGSVRLRSVQVELEPSPAQPALRWQELAGTALDEPNVHAHVFTLDGRYPVEAADVQFEGNGTGQWSLYSRVDRDAPWRLRAGPWVAYAIGAGDGANRSQPRSFPGAVRDRDWKLVGTTRAAQPPRLRLGWRPERLVFVAQGAPPYRLVAGSARAVRAEAPVAQLLEGIRRTRGDGWRPGDARMGPRQVLAGERAKAPGAVPRDWRGWLLWALLLGGALLVVGFAASLLRRPPQPPR